MFNSSHFIKETLKHSPFRHLRLAHSPPLTMESAAELCGVLENTLYLYEIGLYSDPSIELFVKLNQTRLDFEEFSRNYKAYRSYKRRLFTDQVPAGWLEECLDSMPASNHTSPIDALITQMGLSKIAFCKVFGINPGLIHSLCSGKKCKLPFVVENCFSELGISFDRIDELNERQKEFCDGIRI